MAQIDDIQAQLNSLTANVATLTDRVNSMLSPSHQELTSKMLALLTKWQLRENEMLAWATGTITGGSASKPGYYPMTAPDGTIVLVPSIARIAFEASAFQIVDLVGSNNLALVAALHSGKFVRPFNTATSNISLSIPAGLPVGFNCVIQQNGGQITFNVASGVTPLNAQGLYKSRAKGALVTIVVPKNNEYVIAGDLVS
jgi:hypothetical protein